MRGNWIEQSATQAAANTNPTTLSVSTNLPTYADVFGSTGTKLVEYEIDDGQGHFECGYGTVTLSTLSLSRDYPLATYDAGATPKYASGTVARLATFSGPVTVRCAPLASSVGGNEALHMGIGIGNGYSIAQSDVSYGTSLQGWRNFIPFLWTGSRPITSCSITVDSAGSAGTLRVGIMEVSGPSAYTLIAEFTVNSQFSLTTSGQQTINNFPKLFLPPGPYIMQFLPIGQSGNVKLKASANFSNNRMGLLGRQSDGRPNNNFLDSAGASTLATSMSGTGSGGYANYNYLPDFILGMS